VRYGRLTAIQAHEKGYIPACVKVNGKEYSNSTVIDDNEGWIEVFVFDDKGVNLLTPEGELLTVRIHGEVEYIPNAID
jgi:hypothetical protein